MKCDVCKKEIVGDAYHPAYVDGWKRTEGTTCSHECSIRFIDEKMKSKQGSTEYTPESVGKHSKGSDGNG